MNKVCGKCGINKDISEFTKDKSKPSGVRSWCKQCAVEYRKNYDKVNKDKIRETRKKYSEEHREQEQETRKKYKEEHKEQIREYRKAHKEQGNQRHNKYYWAHRELLCKRQNEYCKNNKDKIRQRDTRYRRNNSEKITITRHKYNVKNEMQIREHSWRKQSIIFTCEEYELLLAKQGGVCVICGKAETAFDTRQNVLRKLSVDHDHATGRVRGLLCQRCNQGLGHFRDDIDLMQSAILYLDTYK